MCGQGSEGGVYYIRQVGDCLWWFGTELRDIEPGLTGQLGFANVASGRVDGTASRWSGPTFRLATSWAVAALASSTTRRTTS